MMPSALQLVGYIAFHAHRLKPNVAKETGRNCALRVTILRQTTMEQPEGMLVVQADPKIIQNSFVPPHRSAGQRISTEHHTR